MSKPEDKFDERCAALSPEALQELQSQDAAGVLALTRTGLVDVWPRPSHPMRSPLDDLRTLVGRSSTPPEHIYNVPLEAFTPEDRERLKNGESLTMPRDMSIELRELGKPGTITAKATFDEVIASAEAQMQRLILGQNVVTENDGHHELIPTSVIVAGARLDDGRPILDVLKRRSNIGVLTAAAHSGNRVVAELAAHEQARALDAANAGLLADLRGERDGLTPSGALAALRVAQRLDGVSRDPVDDIAQHISDLTRNAQQLEPLTPIVCPQCGAEHNRRPAQGGVIEPGSVVLCYCGVPMRVMDTHERFAEEIDLKTCSVEDFKRIDRLKQDMKRAQRAWAQRQARNRENAMRGKR